MERKFVQSSNVISIGYQETAQTLEVEFKGGSVYQYYNVPKTIYDQLMQAPSKGQFLAHQIKDRFPFARVG